MLYKEDWSEAGERWKAFWQGEVVDRVVLAVTAPRDNKIPEPEPQDDEIRYTDLEYIIPAANARMQNTFFGGEALPTDGEFTYLSFAEHGAPQVDFFPYTVWPHPFLARSSPIEYQFNPDNKWWKLIMKILMALKEDSQGKYFVPLPNGLLPTDVLSLLRGPNNLCMDLIDNPQGVSALLHHLIEVRQWQLEQVMPIIKADGGVAFDSYLWGPGKTVQLNCDFSIMISPESFREFLMPEVMHFARWSDRCWYHLDGAGALRHLPAILEVPKLRFVQLVPAASRLPGKMQALDWRDALKKIKSAGKGVQMWVSYNRVEEAIKLLGPKGLAIRTEAPTEEAARYLLKKAERWSCQHP